MCLVIPLLLLFCQCGSVAGMPDLFKDMPFGVKEHLIPHHTEGKGEDKVTRLYLLPMPCHVASISEMLQYSILTIIILLFCLRICI